MVQGLLASHDSSFSFVNNTVRGFISETNPVLSCLNSWICVVQNNTFDHIIAQNVISYIYTDLGAIPSKENNTLSQNTFSNVQAMSSGGAIYAKDVNLNISGNQFIRVNNSYYDLRGGAVLI